MIKLEIIPCTAIFTGTVDREPFAAALTADVSVVLTLAFTVFPGHISYFTSWNHALAAEDR